MKHRILCVDDEIDNVDALERIFRKKYTVLKATSAAEGLAILKKNDVALIISDQRMPRKTGVEFLKESMELCPNAIRILLTGYTDVDSVIDAINKGEVYRYITKPWDPLDLANTIDKAIEKYDLSAELKSKNEALEKALVELKSLDDAKNNFMILINHELKTPLTIVLSFLELLKETSLNDEQIKYLSKITNGTQKLKNIIEDVLLFVSAETGVLKLSKRKLSTHKIMENLSEKFQKECEIKNQKLRIPRNDYALKADSQVMQMILDRLLSNAIRFGHADSPITIETHAAKEGHIEIVITNEAPPMSPKTIEQIMKPFTLNEDILKHSQGLGLGLSLTQALLKRHGSQLSIECPKGQVRASFLMELD